MKTLEQLKYYPTRYEIVLTDGTESIRLGFDAKKTKIALLTAMRRNGELVIAKTGLGDDEEFTWRRGEWHINGWVVRFSGHTEREFAAAA